MAATDIHRTIEAVFRIESARLVAGIGRLVRDLGVAEELVQDALEAALKQWPESGVPDKPGAWLMAVGKRRAIDLIRREKLLERKQDELGRQLGVAKTCAGSGTDAAVAEDIDGDLLRLIFTACHPVLPIEGQVALTLRLLGGLTTKEIARAFLLTESTVAQRIVRAKHTLAEEDVAFEVPDTEELGARLSSVLGVIYLIFNEGYSPTAGDRVIRPDLCGDALRLGRVLAELIPQEPEVHGLVALMEIQASRSRARIGSSGGPVLLKNQNRGLWNQMLIRRGLAALERAEKLGGVAGPYALQAAIAACHARAHSAEETDWKRIVALYDELSRIMRSPVIDLNRAVAVGMAFGPQAGLDLVDALAMERSLRHYHLLPSVRADLLAKLSRLDEAGAEFERAAWITQNLCERKSLLDRAAWCVIESAERQV